MSRNLASSDSNGFDERIRSESMAASPVKVSDLTCADCKFRYDDSDPFKNGQENEDGRLYGVVTKCYKYDHKPEDVMSGEECELKEK